MQVELDAGIHWYLQQHIFSLLSIPSSFFFFFPVQNRKYKFGKQEKGLNVSEKHTLSDWAGERAMFKIVAEILPFKVFSVQ